jgi:mRNA interferase MazF
MSIRRGDVVLVDYPYTDRTGSKVRPTLVVSADEINNEDDAVIAAITSVVRASLKSSELFVDLTKPDAVGSGLLSDSVVECWNLLTIDQKFIVHKIGRLSRGLMRQVDDCLKKGLGVKP